MITSTSSGSPCLSIPERELDDPTLYAYATSLVEKANWSRVARGELPINPREAENPVEALTEVIRSYAPTHPEAQPILEKLESIPEVSRQRLHQFVSGEKREDLLIRGGRFEIGDKNAPLNS